MNTATRALSLLIAISIAGAAWAADPTPPPPRPAAPSRPPAPPTAKLPDEPESFLPPGMRGGYESVKGTVLKVFAVEDNGARYRAYVAKWKDQDVVVADPLGKSDKKVGDDITFMAQRIEIPGYDGTPVKMLQFVIMEVPSVVPLLDVPPRPPVPPDKP